MRGNSGGVLSVTQEEDPETGLLSDTIPLTMFSCPGAAGFKVRGPNYLQDKKKVYADPSDREICVIGRLCSAYYLDTCSCWQSDTRATASHGIC